jgi:hypothetical protein
VVKIFGSCHKCFDGTSPPPAFGAELDDDGVVRMECPNGHRSFDIVQANKFELLFDFGVLAFRDGYYREAVTSFNVALERSQEHFVFEIVGRTPAAAGLEQSWKEVAKQSERQFGAFAFLYLLETNTSWLHIPQKDDRAPQ